MESLKISYDQVKYLVFDIESIPDARLIRTAKYPGDTRDDHELITDYKNEILAKTDGVSDFIPVTFQMPVSLCIAKVGDDFSLLDIVSLDDPQFRAAEMARLFWIGVEELYSHASMVTFNGRGFDVPLMELMAFRYGIKAKRHFKDKFAGRFRFGTKHIDLQDWMSNFNAIRMAGGLNLLAKVLGKPGKMSTKGAEVYEMHREVKLKEINEYCVHDVLDTYFVFLRSRVLLGEITLEKEQERVHMAKLFMENSLERIPAFKEYLENWGDWDPWP